MLSALINAGGGSTRMGTHKALLPLPPAGEPLLSHTVAAAAAVVDGPIFVVANHPPVQAAAAALPGVTLLADDLPGKGPLAGIAAALAQTPDWMLALACDLPLLQVDLLRLLADLCGHAAPERSAVWDAVVPVVDGRAESLCAVYHPRCLPYIQDMLAQDTLRVRDLYALVRVRHVEEAELRRADPTLQSFTNVNTPQEWEAILRRIS
jgi:molybdopterin-guanine dinucleotide biosynthesis protein A